jgi:8-oxo-dGTP pyrophosphatase MutT (NUDIX family)
VPAPALSSHDVLGRLARALHRGPAEPGFEGARPSAVLVLVAEGHHGAEVLLTRRSLSMRNHRGEVSFPGGRLDPGETYEQAALREADEEVGLPHHAVELVGRLSPISTLVSKSWIVPVVGRLLRPVEVEARTEEVDRVLWTPLHDLTRPGTFREEWWGLPDGERPLYFFELDDETVWGATARMLHEVLRVAHGVVGHEPPAD